MSADLPFDPIDPRPEPPEEHAPEDAGPRAGESSDAPEPSPYSSIAPAGTEPNADSAPPTPEAPQPPPPHVDTDAEIRSRSASMTRRSLVVGALGAAAGYAGYRWIDRSEKIGRQELPLREAFQFDAKVARGVFDERGLAPTYPVDKAVDLRFNGPYGVRDDIDPASWRLQMAGVANPEKYPQFQKDITTWKYVMTPRNPDGTPAASDSKGPVTTPQPGVWTRAKDSFGDPMRGQEEAGESDSALEDGTPGLSLTMADLLKLPRHELVTQFKCIEGWSEIVHWTGVRLVDLLDLYPPAQVNGRDPRFVYMETPYGDYYCGYNLSACRHPQSLLVTEMSGKPLTQLHGAPLRLHMPIKYGYKQIKRIGLIAYTDKRPDDYWTKLGYDWYAGL
jgi:hypothetical protein